MNWMPRYEHKADVSQAGDMLVGTMAAERLHERIKRKGEAGHG